jgi:hypothetical protein
MKPMFTAAKRERSPVSGRTGWRRTFQRRARIRKPAVITATATGFLVAVALSPPSAVLGLALAMARGQYAAVMTFNLVLTFFGIVLGGWLSLRYFGVTPGDATGGRGSRARSTMLVLGTLIAVGGLVAWQARQAPDLQKSDMTRDALRITQGVVADAVDFRLLDSRAVFVREEIDGLEREGLLVRTVVQSTGAETQGDGIGTEALRGEIDGVLRQALTGF